MRIGSVRSVLVPQVLAILLAGCMSHAEVTPQPRVARVAHPQATTAQAGTVYPGEVRARFESALGFRVAGKISKRHVDVGSHVRRNDVIAELDPRDLALAMASARAGHASAAAALALAQSEHDRYKTLFERRFVSQFEFDAKVNALAAARAHVSEARAALDTTRNQAGYAELRADTDGVITALTAEVGQVVAAGQVVATLARDGASEVEIDVSEHRVGSHHHGQPASIELWTESGKQHAGRIREISPAADAVTRTYRVRVAFDDEAAAPRLGQTARVHFASSTDSDEWLVPLSALYEKDGKPALWQVDPQSRRVHLAVVDVERYGEDGALVARGLDGDNWIVTAGVHRLREGEVVNPVDTENRPITF